MTIASPSDDAAACDAPSESPAPVRRATRAMVPTEKDVNTA
jgi:hypothetical protein